MGMGWTKAQACDLVAHLHGIPRTDRGWTLHEVDHLLFLRSLVRAGQLVS
jgi:hypothetical protein